VCTECVTLAVVQLSSSDLVMQERDSRFIPLRTILA
jgi:hypothetical protein